LENWQTNPAVKLLTDLAAPSLMTEQLDALQRDTLHVQQIGSFDAANALDLLKSKEGKRVLGADFGGDKGTTRLFEVRDASLVLLNDYADDIQSNDGKGYLESLQKTARYAEAHDIPFGISWGGPLNGTQVVFHPKAKLFMAELEAQYNSDLAKISLTITACFNDGPAGLLSGAVEAYRDYKATTVLFAINGGGLGLAVLSDNTMYATEAGHAEGLAALNTYKQTSACGVFGATYTCLEQLGANKAGIEVQWQLAGHDYSRARDIEDRYKAGDQLAGELYDHSALVVAHMIAGTAKAFTIDLSDPTTAIVCHGGAFKFPDYGARLQQILCHFIANKPVNLLMTKDYTDPNSNACLDGAAIAAITA
jgi:hypothetical protein